MIDTETTTPFIKMLKQTFTTKIHVPWKECSIDFFNHSILQQVIFDSVSYIWIHLTDLLTFTCVRPQGSKIDGMMNMSDAA